MAEAPLSVVRAFGGISWQGLPLTGYRRFGVPPGGAWDQESFALANALLGNAPEDPALEVIGGTVELRAEVDCLIAIVGAEAGGNRRFSVSAGTSFVASLAGSGHAFYVAVRRGGDRSDSRLAQPPRSLETVTLRVVNGPHAHLLGSVLRSGTVSNLLSRAGVRLSAGHGHDLELPSEPACIGAIQVTPGGIAIILGPDGPTIGGYPRVAVVCSADLDRVAQLRPGAKFHFEEVSLDQARDLALHHRRLLLTRLSELRLGALGSRVHNKFKTV